MFATPGSDSGRGRVAAVTGGAGGIGRAICAALGAAGRRVAVCDLRAQDADDAVRELRSDGVEALAVAVDITDAAAVRGALQTIERELGAVEILVNNAGWDELRPFARTDEDFWRRVLEINFLGALRMTHGVLGAMTAAGFGRIVSTASDAARVGSSLEAVYAGAKGAVVSFSKSLAREVATDGVTVNVVCPGPTRTPLLEGLAAAAPDAEKVLAAMQRAVPMKRIGEPADVAAAVAYLTSEEAGYVTGQTLSVSGGLTMA